MNTPPNIAIAAFLIADPARAAMLMSLLDGSARSAGELACVAGVTAQTASSHLGKLLDGGLLAVETEGRHRYYRLAGAHVAEVLEALASLSVARPVRHKTLSKEAHRLQFARCCYNHLAGGLGVAVAQAMQAKGYLKVLNEKQFEVMPAGKAWCEQLGINVSALKFSRRGQARQCLDWTERQHHLAGPLGEALLNMMSARGWLRRTPASRVIEVTREGADQLRELLGIDVRNIALRPSSEASKLY